MLQPGFAECGELALEPAGDDVDGEAAARQVVGGGAEFGEDAGVPQAGVDGGDDLQALGGEEEGETEAGRLVLELGAVAGHVADLAQRVLEAVVLGEDGEFAVVLVAPVGTLLDLAGDESPADVGDPVGEFHGLCGHGELLLRNIIPGTPNPTGAISGEFLAEAEGGRRIGRRRGRSGRGATGGAGDAREVDVASPREVQSHLHAVDRGSRPRGPSRKTRPVSYRGPLNFTKV